MDLKAELKNFKAINLEAIAKDEAKIPDNIRNSVFLYNKAIESLKTGSEDIAIIELKKATSMNPRFYEAMNLLGVCYSYSGDNEKAVEIFEKVLRAEPNSVTAMMFLQQHGLGELVQQQKYRQMKNTVPQPSEPLKRVRTDKTIKTGTLIQKKILADVLKIGMGFAAGILLAIALYALLPQKEPIINEPIDNAEDNSDILLRAEYEAKLDELKKKYDLLQKDKESAVQQADYYKAVIKLYDIEKLVADRKYEEAADMLLLMRTVEFRDAEKKKMDELNKKVMPLAAQSAYDQGYKLYNSRKYQDALRSFEKVQVYEPEYKRMDVVFYYRGRSCQALNDSRSALALYQKLIEAYPDSAYAKSAKARIKELTQKP